MKHKLIATCAAALLVCAPFMASAATLEDTEAQVMYALGQIAALKAQQENTSVACALFASTESVSVGKPFALIWNTFGAKEPSNSDSTSQWARGGIATIVADKPGIYQYRFVFNGVSGGQTVCKEIVSVHAVQ